MGRRAPRVARSGLGLNGHVFWTGNSPSALSGGARGHVGAALNAAGSYAIKTDLDPERLCQLARMAAEGGALLVQADRRVLESLVQPGAQSGGARYGLTARELQ